MTPNRALPMRDLAERGEPGLAVVEHVRALLGRGGRVEQGRQLLLHQDDPALRGVARDGSGPQAHDRLGLQPDRARDLAGHQPQHDEQPEHDDERDASPAAPMGGPARALVLRGTTQVDR